LLRIVVIVLGWRERRFQAEATWLYKITSWWKSAWFPPLIRGIWKAIRENWSRRMFLVLFLFLISYFLFVLKDEERWKLSLLSISTQLNSSLFF